jgi:hypothetical protein
MKTRRRRISRFITRRLQAMLIDTLQSFFLMKMFTFKDTLTLRISLRKNSTKSMHIIAI